MPTIPKNKEAYAGRIRTKLKIPRDTQGRSTWGKSPPPKIHYWFHGVEEAVRSAGLAAGIDIYVPSPNLTDRQNYLECAKWWRRHQYKRERLEVGKYQAREQARLEKEAALANERAQTLMEFLKRIDE